MAIRFDQSSQSHFGTKYELLANEGVSPKFEDPASIN